MKTHDDVLEAAFQEGMIACLSNVQEDRCPYIDSDGIDCCVAGEAVATSAETHEAWIKGWNAAYRCQLEHVAANAENAQILEQLIRTE